MRFELAVIPMFVAAAVVLPGCASRRPVLYPNAQLQRVGAAAAQRDVDACMALADQYLASGSKAAPVARDAATGTAVGGVGGAAVGAVGGAIAGNAGQGAAIGAATGATAGLLGSLFGSAQQRDPDPVYANFVTRCLGERGYETIGWE